MRPEYAVFLIPICEITHRICASIRRPNAELCPGESARRGAAALESLSTGTPHRPTSSPSRNGVSAPQAAGGVERSDRRKKHRWAESTKIPPSDPAWRLLIQKGRSRQLMRGARPSGVGCDNESAVMKGPAHSSPTHSSPTPTVIARRHLQASVCPGCGTYLSMHA